MFGQDYEMLNFINKYRTSHNKPNLKYSTKLADIAIKCNTNNIVYDTLVHTKIANTVASGEIIVKDTHLPVTAKEKSEFGYFLKTIFGFTYTEPSTTTEVITLTKLYILYKYDQSTHHKATLLGDFKQVGFDTVIKDIKKHDTPKPIVINGKVYERKNTFNYFEVNFYSVIDFN